MSGQASAKTDVGIAQAFEEVVDKILDNPVLLVNTAPGRPGKSKGVGLGETKAEDAPGGCC